MDADDDYCSLSKGVFVIPFTGEPSNPSRPLQKTYSTANERYEDAYWDFEKERTQSQLDEIATWLDTDNTLKVGFRIKRIPVALVQNLSPSVPPELSCLTRAITVNGRNIGDIAAATRAVAVGCLGEAALAAKKAGRTPIDEVDRWWAGLRETTSRGLLVHVQNAQLVPPTVLAELIYILHLHSTPFRLLIAVPSITVFTSTRSFIEPGDVSLSVLSAGRSKRRGAEVNAILRTASDPLAVPISISDDVRDDLIREEDMFGGGAPATLKQLKWLLLHHGHNSPLAALAQDDSVKDRAAQIKSIIEGMKEGREVDGEDLFMVDSVPDLQSVQNPAPRLSILHALAKPAAFLGKEEKNESVPVDEDATPTRGTKRKEPDSDDLGARFKEIEALHALWRSAGKAVNLWDWLEGFRGAMSDGPGKRAGSDSENGNGDTAAEGEGAAVDETANGVEPGSEEEQAQHARFVRFIEEARMLGLVRARGSRTSRRTDEVMKGVLMM